jgi:alkylation response protein AidB-like acyl-CoA dehydrogenase
MDYGLNDEQTLLRDVARSFVDRVCPPAVAKQWDDDSTYPPELIDGFAEMGWFGLPLGEDVGGGGGSAIELAILGEELGRASLDVAQCFILTLMAALVIERFGTREMREQLLPAIVAGRQRLSIGMSEPDAGSDVAALRTTATVDGDDFVVNGQKMWCTGAGLPDTRILAYVRTDPAAESKHHGLSAILVDPLAPGVELRRIPTLARHILGTYEVFFDDVRVPRSQLVGPLDEGWRVMLSGIDLERVLISGGYVGAAQATLDEAVEHGKTRRQFGRPVGEFQAVTHALADMQTEIDCSRLLVQRAAWLHSTGQPCGREASMAKLKGSETYVAAARLGMQVCAGSGFSTESVMSFRWRESIVAPISGGTSQIQRNAIARSMGLRGY